MKNLYHVNLQFGHKMVIDFDNIPLELIESLFKKDFKVIRVTPMEYIEEMRKVLKVLEK